MINNIKQVAKHSAIYGLGNISVKIIGLVLIPLYTNPKYFSVEDFGIISMLDVTIELLIAVLGLSIYQAFTRWYWDKEYISRQKNMFFTMLVFNIIIVLIAGLPFYFLSDRLSLALFANSKYEFVLKIIYVSVIFQVIAQSVFTLMKLQSKSLFYSSMQILKLAVTLILTIYFVVFQKKGIQGIYEAQILGFIPFFIIISIYVFKNLAFKFEFGILKELIKYSIPLMLGSISATVLTIFDRYSLNYLASLEDVGIYSLGYRIANTIKIVVVTSIQLAISPIIFQKMNDPDNKRFYSKLMTYLAFVISFLILIVTVFGYEIIKVFTSNDAYISATLVIPVISLSILFATLKDTATTGLQIAKKTLIVGSSLFLVTLLNIGLNIILIPYLKIHGASLSTLLSQIILFIIIFKSAQKNYFIPYELKKIILIVILTTILAGASLFLNGTPLLIRLILKFLILILFPVSAYLFGFFESIEIMRIKESFNKWKNPFKWKENISKIKFK